MDLNIVIKIRSKQVLCILLFDCRNNDFYFQGPCVEHIQLIMGTFLSYAKTPPSCLTEAHEKGDNFRH